MMFALRGSTARYPLSPPGTLKVSPTLLLGTAMLLLSCCEAYTQYGQRVSVSIRYSSAVIWLFCVDQVWPPSVETLAPPSLPLIRILLFVGLIQKSWLSPCGVPIPDHVLPPSVDLYEPVFTVYAVSTCCGSA